MRRQRWLPYCLPLARIGLLLLRGAATVALVYPFCGTAARLRLKQRWSQAMLDILGVRLEAEAGHARPGCLLVANHISWLDIFVINAARPAAFVAKEEVRRWPVAGWLAAMNDTVFLRRGSRGHAHAVNDDIAGLLAAGRLVAVFPEGTTTDGTRVLPFHAALLQPALAAGRPVVPAAVSYWRDGERCLAPRYDGDVSFLESLVAILDSRGLVARLDTCPPLAGGERRLVAAAARDAVEAAAGLAPPALRQAA